MDKDMVWEDKKGIVHGAVGEIIVRSEPIVLWTACEKMDIPANQAWVKRNEDIITCEDCK